jgi:hypothetical protein
VAALGEVEMKTRQRRKKPEKRIDLEPNFVEKPFLPFEVDILATEDFARIHRSRPLSPEHELMAAVLEEAIADYQRCWKARDKKGMDRFADAQAWILDSNSEWIFSFANCCEALGIEPDYVRQGLLRSKQEKRTRPSSASAIEGEKNQPRRLRQAA